MRRQKTSQMSLHLPSTKRSRASRDNNESYQDVSLTRTTETKTTKVTTIPSSNKPEMVSQQVERITKYTTANAFRRPGDFHNRRLQLVEWTGANFATQQLLLRRSRFCELYQHAQDDNLVGSRTDVNGKQTIKRITKRG